VVPTCGSYMGFPLTLGLRLLRHPRIHIPHTTAFNYIEPSEERPS